MKRRAFLALLGAAPLAAMAPWRPAVRIPCVDYGTGLSSGVLPNYKRDVAAFARDFGTDWPAEALSHALDRLIDRSYELLERDLNTSH